MTFASLIVPAFNAAKTLPQTLTALLAQTHRDFEIIVVDDGSTDDTLVVAERFADDPRLRILSQPNRGLAGARNSGIWVALGEVIRFCDAHDIWEPGKLAAQINHLARNPHIGVSFSGSSLIDDARRMTGHARRPRLRGITAAHTFKRNPIGNGSAPVIRRTVFDAIALRPAHESTRDWFFDETFRQSTDIDCWMRIALTTPWQFECVPGLLTRYRICAHDLSVATERQHAAWERMVTKLTPHAPALFARHTTTARSCLCLRCLSNELSADFMRRL